MSTIALVGCAHPHSADYMRTIDRANNFSTVVWDRDLLRAKKFAQTYQAGLALSWDELETQGLIGILILSETAFHEEDVVSSLRLGCPIFVEKPLGVNGYAARHIAKLLHSSSVKFHTGFFLRTIPALQSLRRLIELGKLGEIVDAAIHFTHDGKLAGWLNEWPWVSQPQLSGYGGFGDLAVHCIDLLSWLLNSRIASGSVRLNYSAGLENQDCGGIANLSFECGTNATVETSWIDPSPRFFLSVTGMRGNAHLSPNGQLWFQNKDTAEAMQIELGTVRLDAANGLLPFLELLRDENATSDLVPINEALAANEAIDRLYQTSKEKLKTDSRSRNR